MSMLPDIAFVKIEHGLMPRAHALNRHIGPDEPLLVATLDIDWPVEDPISSVGQIEDALLRLWPRFAEHECRGEATYHVFLGGGRVAANGPANSPEAGLSAAGTETFDGPLALAHLIEHAVIDFQCSITGQSRCSGITGAHRNPPGRFDVIIECPDRRVGLTCLALAVLWLTSAIGGQPPGPPEDAVLAAARFAFGHPEMTLTPPAVARRLKMPERRAASALASLRDVGCLAESPCTLNFTGTPVYRLSGSPNHENSESLLVSRNRG